MRIPSLTAQIEEPFCDCQHKDKAIPCGMATWKTPVGRVRLVGMIEGVSFLLLMGIAMPLKYLAGMPQAVKLAGWCHGGLFILYCMAIFAAWTNRNLSFSKSVLAFVAALVPFGPFLIDRKLAADDALPDAEG